LLNVRKNNLRSAFKSDKIKTRLQCVVYEIKNLTERFYYNKIPKAIKIPSIMNSGIAEGQVLPELLIRF
jgi:hypothetical protein